MKACSVIARTDQTLRAGTCEKGRQKARVVTYVRTGSRWFRRKFYQACLHLGLTAREVESADVELTAEDREALKIPVHGKQCADAKWRTVYVVRGTAEALAEFSKRRCVEHSHPVLHGRVAYRGTGWGEKPEPRPRRRRRKRRSCRNATAGGARVCLP